MSEDMRDEESKKEGEALKAEQAGGEDQVSETREAKETKASNDTPETQESALDEIEETEGTEESTEQVPAGGREEREGFFKKKKDPRDEKIEEPTGRVRQQMAELESFRKQIDKERFAAYEMGIEDTIERVLPITDNSERGLATMPEDTKKTPLVESMEKIYKQLRKTLEKAGVKAIEAVGREFDPSYHNVVMHVDDDSLGENIVAEELWKGYMCRDSVVRHNVIKVAN